MSKQVLSNLERKKIRSKLYEGSINQSVEYEDGKISFFIKHIRNKNVLDIGSIDHYEGNWKSKYWLFKGILENAKSVIGLDYYEEGVKALRKEGFDIIYGDAQNFEIDKKFDVITAGDLIEHLPNPGGFIESATRHLNDNGAIIITTPNPWCWKYISYHIFKKRLDRVNKEHTCWFCIETLSNLFKRYGFTMKEYEYCSRRSYEKIMPLPAHIKHTTLNIVFTKD